LLTDGDLFEVLRVIVLVDGVNLVIIVVSCSRIENLLWSDGIITYQGQLIEDVITFIEASVVETKCSLSFL
jgi:hypothetical protein